MTSPAREKTLRSSMSTGSIERARVRSSVLGTALQQHDCSMPRKTNSRDQECGVL